MFMSNAVSVQYLLEYTGYGLCMQNEVKVHAYMLELYQDNLLDMFDPKQVYL